MKVETVVMYHKNVEVVEGGEGQEGYTYVMVDESH